MRWLGLRDVWYKRWKLRWCGYMEVRFKTERVQEARVKMAWYRRLELRWQGYKRLGLRWCGNGGKS